MAAGSGFPTWVIIIIIVVLVLAVLIPLLLVCSCKSILCFKKCAKKLDCVKPGKCWKCVCVANDDKIAHHVDEEEGGEADNTARPADEKAQLAENDAQKKKEEE